MDIQTRRIMTEIAQRMSNRGIPVDRVAFDRALKDATTRLGTDPERRERTKERLRRVYVEQLREVRAIDQRSSSWSLHPTWGLNDFYWMTSKPALSSIPFEFLTMVPNSVQVYPYQPYQFFAARFGGQLDLVEQYHAGGDLAAIFAEQLGLDRAEAKAAFYRALSGLNEPAVAERMPWLIELRDSYNDKARDGETVATWLGTVINAAQPRFTFMQFMQRTVLDVCREGVIHTFRVEDSVPYLIYHDTVIGEPGFEDSFQRALGSYFGLRTVITRRSGPRQGPTLPAA